jgi:hypothetical protein
MLVICFWFLLCFNYSFIIVGDTYVVYWFGVVVVCSLVRWLLVVFVWLKFTIWGPGAAVGHVRSFSLVWCFLFSFFTSALQGWGLVSTVGAIFFFMYYYYFLGVLRCSTLAPTSGHVVVLFSVS